MPLGEDFMNRMGDYLMQPEDKGLARRILHAAHLYASYSEFQTAQVHQYHGPRTYRD